MITRLFTVEAQLIRRTQTGADDRYNQATWVEDEPVTVKGHLEPVARASLINELEDRPESRATHRWWMAPVDCSTRDRIVLASSRSFEIEGAPRLYLNPMTGEHSHLEVDLVEYA